MKKTFFSGCRDAVCGFFMAPADSVPGVSGGTVAFSAGVYDDFIGAFGNIAGRDRVCRSSLFFLLRLGAGRLIGMALSVSLLVGWFTTHIYPVCSLFLGRMVGSLSAVAMGPTTLKEKLPPVSDGTFRIGWFLLGVAVVALFAGLKFVVQKRRASHGDAHEA